MIRSEFVPYVKIFEDITGLRGNRAPICFGTTTPPMIAYARHIDDAMHEIVVNKYFWDQMSPDSKEILILHELGHLIANLEHDDSPHPDNPNRIGSIMNSATPINFYMGSHREYYYERYREAVLSNTARHRTEVRVDSVHGQCN
jgi:hypothetical protein